MILSVDVTKKGKDDYSHPPREGAYVHGLYLEGAKWDSQTGGLGWGWMVFTDYTFIFEVDALLVYMGESLQQKLLSSCWFFL